MGRLLVANRGEIASRIFRTARSLGIETIAVYADGDANAPFVRAADHAIALQGQTPLNTYLSTEKILNACATTSADAVHPGYGFLSENAKFARAVQDKRLIWIGPPADAIEQMGDKLTAKRRMQDAGVPTLKAIPITSDTDALVAAEELGFPVLIKATSGGGGRGMRVVHNGDDLKAAITSAQREAKSAFGNATVFLERWIAATRHIEVQIMGDLHGNVVHFFERECSIQRRHQKIIEEAPSPAMTSELRVRLGEAAVAVAEALNYSSAGTVEFLLSGDEFWFLEVNTRLQVEHPVTEAITGFDLVYEQLRIAAGERLGYTQGDLNITGHAIEARLYAEDPAQDFLPTSGTLKKWKPAPIARFDSGVESGTTVNIEFDPMIAKVISHGGNRFESIRKLTRALEQTQIQGIKNNRDFLVQLLKTPEFVQGDTTTDFIERVAPLRERPIEREELNSVLVAVALFTQHQTNDKDEPDQPKLRSQLPAQHHAFEFNGQDYDVKCDLIVDQVYRVVISGEQLDARVMLMEDDFIDIELDSRRVRCNLYLDENTWYVHTTSGDCEIRTRPLFSLQDTTLLTGNLSAPMPGKVLTLEVENNSQVQSGELLLVLEAMKMEHRIVAPYDGVVSAVHVSVGDIVEKDVLLVEMAATEQT
ncbi:MAG: ATP-grasp domain-containing protein [Gammaproteobacteria bacterium]|nr:ATP-grasp domain-containing protein [Gammaproteobacteria bacterium]MYC25862.1 ATP-grasp domain-containing protein [Gammaproteobacteria bacterium]